MITLRAKVFFYLALTLFLPSLVVYFGYSDVVRMHGNSVALEELKDVETYTQRNPEWTDHELERAQAFRSRLTYTDLQSEFSKWIQARSEQSDRLIRLRSSQLDQFVREKITILKAQNAFFVQRLLYMFSGLAVFLLGFVVAGYYFMKRNLFNRLQQLENEIGHFRVMDYQPRLQSHGQDEITDLWAAFRALIDNLYVDLHENLGLKLEGTEKTNYGASIPEQVKTYLIERRSHLDRRVQIVEVPTERRESERRKHA